MPVHLIVLQRGRGLGAQTECAWLEKFVTFDGYAFAFLDQPITDQKLRKHLRKLPVRPAGYQTEVNLAAPDWIDNASRKLDRGYVLTIDYGHHRDEFFAPHRSKGTLQVRAQHRLLQSPFDEIGHADITSHVEWTSIVEGAEACSFEVKGFTDQHHFITGIISELAHDIAQGDADAKAKRTLQTPCIQKCLGEISLGARKECRCCCTARRSLSPENRALFGLDRVRLSGGRIHPHGCPCCVKTAHAVDAWWSQAEHNKLRATACDKAWDSGLGVQHRQIRRTAVDVAAGQIRIRFFKIDSACAVARENAIRKPGAKR